MRKERISHFTTKGVSPARNQQRKVVSRVTAKLKSSNPKTTVAKERVQLTVESNYAAQPAKTSSDIIKSIIRQEANLFRKYGLARKEWRIQRSDRVAEEGIDQLFKGFEVPKDFRIQEKKIGKSGTINKGDQAISN